MKTFPIGVYSVSKNKALLTSMPDFQAKHLTLASQATFRQQADSTQNHLSLLAQRSNCNLFTKNKVQFVPLPCVALILRHVGLFLKRLSSELSHDQGTRVNIFRPCYQSSLVNSFRLPEPHSLEKSHNSCSCGESVVVAY